MDTEIFFKTVKGEKFNKFNERLIKCNLCSTNLTTMLSTQMCERCWELKKRVLADIKLTIKILEDTEGCIVLQR